MAIQKASELIAALNKEEMIYSNPNSDFYDIGRIIDDPEKAADLIRADRKAVIERTIKECQHILKCDADTLADNGMEQKARGLMRGILLLPEALNSILRDLD
jgi:hypothetical protein